MVATVDPNNSILPQNQQVTDSQDVDNQVQNAASPVIARNGMPAGGNRNLAPSVRPLQSPPDEELEEEEDDDMPFKDEEEPPTGILDGIKKRFLKDPGYWVLNLTATVCYLFPVIACAATCFALLGILAALEARQFKTAS
jgi:hypothetical protein